MTAPRREKGVKIGSVFFTEIDGDGSGDDDDDDEEDGAAKKVLLSIPLSSKCA